MYTSTPASNTVLVQEDYDQKEINLFRRTRVASAFAAIRYLNRQSSNDRGSLLPRDHTLTRTRRSVYKVSSAME